MLTPRDEEDLSEIITGATGPLRISGGNTRPIGAPLEGENLTVTGLSGIELYDPGALTLVAKAGTKVSEIDAALAAENQMLAFEPMDHRALLGTNGEPTIGGVVAANVSGPRRVAAGACRDHLLGVRFVDGSGIIVKNGGRVMKNVTGYDLVKLMAGARGTLGVLTEVSLKVLPRPGSSALLTCHGLDDQTAVNAMSAGLSTPFEVNGAVHLSGPDATTVLRIEGFEDSVKYRAEQLTNALANFGTWDTALTDGGPWTWARDAEALGQADGDVWRLSLKATDAPDVVAKVAPQAAFYDWGGSRVWLRVAQGTDVRAKLGAFSGTATLIRASDADKSRLGVFHPEAAPLAKLAQGLRQQFDPRGILNPGLMG